MSITLTPGQLVEFGQSRSACGFLLSSPIGMGGLAVLPIAAEVVQFLAPVLGHSCRLSDIQDNWEGAVIGAALGGVVALLRWLPKAKMPAGQPLGGSRLRSRLVPRFGAT